MRTISAYTHRARSRASIAGDLDRWEERGFEGLLDGAAPGNPPRITEEGRTFMEGKPCEEEQRTCDATQLAEALGEGFGAEASPPKPSANTSARRAIAASAPAMCPANRQTPMRSAKLPKSWRLSKKGSKRRGRPEVPR